MADVTLYLHLGFRKIFVYSPYTRQDTHERPTEGRKCFRPPQKKKHPRRKTVNDGRCDSTSALGLQKNLCLQSLYETGHTWRTHRRSKMLPADTTKEASSKENGKQRQLSLYICTWLSEPRTSTVIASTENNGLQTFYTEFQESRSPWGKHLLFNILAITHWVIFPRITRHELPTDISKYIFSLLYLFYKGDTEQTFMCM